MLTELQTQQLNEIKKCFGELKEMDSENEKTKTNMQEAMEYYLIAEAFLNQNKVDINYKRKNTLLQVVINCDEFIKEATPKMGQIISNILKRSEPIENLTERKDDLSTASKLFQPNALELQSCCSCRIL